MKTHITGGFVILLLWLMFTMEYIALMENFTEQWQFILYLQLFILPVFIAGFLWPWWTSWIVGLVSVLIVFIIRFPTHPMTIEKISTLPLVFWTPMILIVVVSFCFGSVMQAKEQSLRRLKEEVVRQLADINRQKEQYDRAEELIQNQRKDNLNLSSMIVRLTTQSKLLNQKLSTPEVLRGALEAIQNLINPDYCAIYTVAPEKAVVIFQHDKGIRSKTELKNEVKFGNGIIGRAAERQQIIKTEGMPIDTNNLNYSSVELTCALPITYMHKVHGVIYVEKFISNTRDELLVLETFTASVGMALHNAEQIELSYVQAVTDGLTKLYNHKYFIQRLREEYAGAKRYLRPLSLILLDVDYFKQYNDTNGHQMGDVVLEEVAQIIKSSVRQSDIAARYGGEEFVVILTNTDITGAEKVAEKIRLAVESHYFHNREAQPSGKLTCSCGVGTVLDKMKSTEELIEITDQALYKAKAKGRNRIELAEVA